MTNARFVSTLEIVVSSNLHVGHPHIDPNILRCLLWDPKTVTLIFGTPPKWQEEEDEG